MRTVLTILLLLTLSACSSGQQKKAVLREVIAAEEVRSLSELRAHAGLLLESHPELQEGAKVKIRQQIDHVIERQQALKEDEAKILGLLVTTSLGGGADVSKKDLRQELTQVYAAKKENILSLVDLVARMRANKETSDSFDQDMQMFFREFR